MTRLPEVQFSFHFTNLAEEVVIVVLDCVIRQVRPEYFNGISYAEKFQYIYIYIFYLCFEQDMLPKLPMIYNENLRELVS